MTVRRKNQKVEIKKVRVYNCNEAGRFLNVASTTVERWGKKNLIRPYVWNAYRPLFLMSALEEVKAELEKGNKMPSVKEDKE